ncbi:hypothetical protein [Streptomyces geranii]|uniref:hypothetical protein n=1 Tax=Streptomyces geranii TaxID=2058923 RepID=UPI000D042AC4|nr:hypothetical protein [Streptomyces geranii]
MSSDAVLRQAPGPADRALPDPTGAPTGAHGVLPTEPVQITFTPAGPDGAALAAGTGWLQPGGLVVHTGWSSPYPDRTQPWRQSEARAGAQSWIISTPCGQEVAAFPYFSRERAQEAAAVIAAALPDGAWTPGTRADGLLYERAFDASTGPEMLPGSDSRGRPDWGFGAAWILWRMPPTRALYERMIAKHDGPAPTKHCLSCRESVRQARRDGWNCRTGHWPAWGTHPPGYVEHVHCSCRHCLAFVTIGTTGKTTDGQPGALSAYTMSPIRENDQQVPYEERPFAWWRHMLAEGGHVILDNRPCSGLWPQGVRHDDAFLCETGLAGTDTTGTHATSRSRP